ncbi:MAG: hypothetical protein HYT89_02490 [Candidatus Omnitrophica bacterium]|nr:hypothetical protein [Candidatus Omnitrophota bacterium]
MKTRTRWILKHPLQTKYLLLVILAMLIPLATLGFCFYKITFRLLAEQIAFPEAITANLLPVIHGVNRLLLVTLPLSSLLVLWLAVLVSHRLAGPLERLEKELDEILAGNTARRIALREKDDLKGLASKINSL